ncbi:MAG TPA: hypothetical protein VGI10_15375 [Polyangiaceae bacterium]|jgi:hypothetical protein
MRNIILMGVIGALVAAVGCSGSTDIPGAAVQGGNAASSNVSSVGGSTGNAGGATSGSAGQGGTAGSGGGSSDSSGSSGAAGDDGGTITGPTVVITSPSAVTDPDVGPVVVGTQVEVDCTVTDSKDAGAQPVDAASVQFQMFDASGSSMATAPGVAATKPNQYSATFVITDYPNGAISFSCMASDKATPAHPTTVRLSTFVDHGPQIDIIAPADTMPPVNLPLVGNQTVDFKVSPLPLKSGDQGAAVGDQSGDVSLKINAIDVPVAPLPGQPGEYTATVDFQHDFATPVVGTPQLTIVAANKRAAPGPVTRVKNYNVVVDGDGPVITVVSPTAGSVVGGQVVLQFTVTDLLSGVNPESVIVELNQAPNAFTTVGGDWSQVGDAYTFKFQSADLTGSVAQATINITATDNAGNTSSGASHVLYLDNTPAALDLDPGDIRERTTSGSSYVCSIPFDPVGPAAANDLGPAYPSTLFRAIAWDDTNSVPQQQVLHYAGVDASSVYLYIQPDTSKPLLTKKYALTPYCDAVLSTGLELQHLVALDPAGSAEYLSSATPIANYCAAGTGTAILPSDYLCPKDDSDMYRVTAHADSVANGDDAIFVILPGVGAECTGSAWEISSVPGVADGWLCLAVEGKDRVGNQSVSPPLRVCYDSSGGVTPPPCATDPKNNPPPSCVDGCIPPPRFSPPGAGLVIGP